MLTKRSLGKACLGVVSAVAFAGASGAITRDREQKLESELARIEDESKGRLGVAILDTLSGSGISLRGDERFPMCSTFKMLAASAVLARIDRGQSQLEKRIKFETKDVVAYSPVTKDFVEKGMTLAQLCEAALTQSDNTAGNMLLREIDGPAGLTTFIRSLDDRVSRLDRWEVELNEAATDDPRDTTTPLAMLNNMRHLMLGDKLSERSRLILVGWMTANKTGDRRLRAGVHRHWKVADKTGSGDRGTANDIGVFWPPAREPLLASVYLTGSSLSADERNSIIERVAKVAVEFVEPS